MKELSDHIHHRIGPRNLNLCLLLIICKKKRRKSQFKYHTLPLAAITKFTALCHMYIKNELFSERGWMVVDIVHVCHRYCEEMVPLHPCLTLISNCEQTLSSHTSRRLITMEKTKEPEVCVCMYVCHLKI